MDSDLINHFTSLDLSILQRVDPERARGEFVFFFFGGSGAIGIGGAQIPKILAGYDELKALKGGPSKGGDTVSTVTTFGYPEDLKKDDLLAIINKTPPVETLQKLGAGSKSYMASLGYVERDTFLKFTTKEKVFP